MGVVMGTGYAGPGWEWSKARPLLLFTPSRCRNIVVSEKGVSGNQKFITARQVGATPESPYGGIIQSRTLWVRILYPYQKSHSSRSFALLNW
jgi:hypothetical protein